MMPDKEARCYEVLDLMRQHNVSVKDLATVINSTEFIRTWPQTQAIVKGFLYPDVNQVEPKS